MFHAWKEEIQAPGRPARWLEVEGRFSIIISSGILFQSW
jgi:hypothetical protein